MTKTNTMGKILKRKRKCLEPKRVSKKKKNSYSSREMHYITEINEKGYK